MGFADMERLCHAMEDVFQLIRSGTAAMSQDLGNLLLSCSDVLEQMIDDVEKGGDTSSLNPDEQVRALKKWLEELGGKPKQKLSEAPSSAPAVREDADVPPDTGGMPEYDVRITVAAECAMKDVRAMIAIGNLEALGIDHIR